MRTNALLRGGLGHNPLHVLAFGVSGVRDFEGIIRAVLHVHPSTSTGVLQRLVRAQMVLRVDHPFDRRRAVLRLTARGKRVNRMKLGTVESAMAEALDGVSDRNRPAAMRVLGRLADHLEPSPSSSGEERLLGYRPRFGRRPGGRLHA